MSERTFFSLRYALPGYTFILIMIIVAYPELTEILINLNQNSIDVIVALFAFITLLGGSAIGFLISQFWYFVHNTLFNGSFVEDTKEFLRWKFNLEENVHQEIVFLDYVFYLSDKQTIDYVARRFDLQHTLASTFCAVIFGVIFGGFIRNEVFVVNVTFCDSFNAFMADENWFNFFKFFILKGISPFQHQTMYDFGITIVIVCLLLVLVLSFRFIRREHAMMVNVAVRDVVDLKEKFTVYDAHRIFVRQFFRENRTPQEDSN